jgi:farnesyl-diphosphate farnesyltransferase
MAVSEINITWEYEQNAYLDEWMNRVSRSFAVVVSFLEEPLKTYLSTAYLICRVVDNIEDCSQSFHWKKERFSEFLALLENPSQAMQVLSIWKSEDWPGLTQNEKHLMVSNEGFSLWQLYARFPNETREIISTWTQEMVQGMLLIENQVQNPSMSDRIPVRIIRNEEDYDRYCYYVAGTVGHLATRLAIGYYQINDGGARRLLDNCESCGRGLQKTNIVKDFVNDLERGICYLPDKWLSEVDYAPLFLEGALPSFKRKVLENVLSELQSSTDYVLALPVHATGYRMASLLCLFPAYQTILLAAQQRDKLFTSDHSIKISRQTMSECIQDAQRMIVDNNGIHRYSEQLEQAVLAHF